ncbi:MAG: hypothetical protein AB1515_04920 [Nitrospirota bacterium]
MGKLFLTGLLVLLAFGAGYVAGGRDQRAVRGHMEQLKNEMARKTLDLERLLTRTRIRGHLIETRDALTLAQTHLQHQDYGMAKQAVEQARASLQSALRLEDREAAARLRPLEGELERLADAMPRLGGKAGQEIERIKARIPLNEPAEPA